MNKDEALKMAIEALESLWKIIDDIDTLDDLCKENDKLFRELVYKKQRTRFEITGITTDGYKLTGGAIQACKEALEQPAQEPVAWMDKKDLDFLDGINHQIIRVDLRSMNNTYGKGTETVKLYTHPAPQPAQEPVAWMSKKRGDVSKAKMYFNEGEEILPLYTHPAPSWQGLSEEEIIEEAAKIIILRSFKGENV